MRHFGFSAVVTLICLGLAAYVGGVKGVLLAAVLGVLEVSLSFDNAVVNASVLRGWNHFWKTLFLTVGILIAVFGMRLIFPLLIVSQTSDMSIIEAGNLALKNPTLYSEHLIAHHAEVAAFGGAFLMLVCLNFLIDDEKELHWLGWVEEKIAAMHKLACQPEEEIALPGLDVDFTTVRPLSGKVQQLFSDEAVDAVYLIYTRYISAMTQRTVSQRLLPLAAPATPPPGEERPSDYEFEPKPEELLGHLLGRYVDTLIYSAVLESIASEQGARMTSMTSATKNAGEMIDRLTLSLNRARQAAITTEISEIVSTAEALK